MRVSGLFIYPIKACGGVALGRHQVVERGFAHDRRFMLVDRAGTFVTQREVPKLALVSLALVGSELQVSASDISPLHLEADPAGGDSLTVRIWDHVGSALRHREGSQWFSEVLGDQVSLVYMPDDERRPVTSPLLASRNLEPTQPGDIMSFADGYPFLLISEASLADLNARLATPVTMRRFRPNIVISGCQPYAEDHFSRLTVGKVAFRAVKRCERCSVVSVDPSTGRLGKEPLRTLATYRLDDGKVWFGMNLIHDAAGTLCVGDEVRLSAAR